MTTGPAPHAERATRLPTLRHFVQLARPHQWVKNGFVLIGWLFADGWRDPRLTSDALVVAVAFCLCSSAVYVLNDVLDRHADRQHARKRLRPVASGVVGIGAALAFGAALMLAGLATAGAVSAWALATTGGYIVLNAAYSAGLKHVAILDVFMIAGGFMLRILAGTLGIGVAPSQWLLVCGLMVTVFLGFTKRRAELFALEGAGGDHRPVLAEYTPELLDKMISISAASVLASYALYTVDYATIALHGTDRLVLTLPFVLYGVFRFIFLLHRRRGGSDPAWDLLHDLHLLAAAVGWLAATVWILA